MAVSRPAVMDGRGPAGLLRVGMAIVDAAAALLPRFVGVLLLVFLLFHWVGGDPAYVLAGKFSNPDDIANIRHQLGLDRPLWVQFGLFLRQVATWDYGTSWSTHEAVTHLLATRLGPSLALILPTVVLETVLALLLAIAVTALRQQAIDRIVTVVTTALMSVSLLIYVMVGQYWLAFEWGWFPVQGWAAPGQSWVPFAVLPILLGLAVSLAPTLRLYRTFLHDEITQDYVRTARAKGLGEVRVLGVHVLRNAAIPIVTQVLANLPGVLVGTFLIERFFSIPGIGREAILAVERSDWPVIEAITVVVALATLLCNGLAEVVYRLLDPRVGRR